MIELNVQKKYNWKQPENATISTPRGTKRMTDEEQMN